MLAAELLNTWGMAKPFLGAFGTVAGTVVETVGGQNAGVWRQATTVLGGGVATQRLLGLVEICRGIYGLGVKKKACLYRRIVSVC